MSTASWELKVDWASSGAQVTFVSSDADLETVCHPPAFGYTQSHTLPVRLGTFVDMPSVRWAVHVLGWRRPAWICCLSWRVGWLVYRNVKKLPLLARRNDGF